MQDNFLFNKLQTGSSLFMKSDHNGISDKSNIVAPLIIKSSSEGINHFTDWDSIASSLQQKSLARFDDLQPNRVNYKVRNPYRTIFKGIPDTNSDFSDEWYANDIKILDDLAFVAYENYTDVHRKDINIGSDFRQYAKFKTILTASNNTYYEFERIGSLRSSNPIYINQDLVYPNDIDQLTLGQVSQVQLNDQQLHNITSFYDTILKVNLKGTVNSGASNIDNSTKTILPQTGYFVFGGFLANDSYIDFNNTDASLSFNSDRGYLSYNDVDYVGPRSLLSNASWTVFYDAYNELYDDELQQPYSSLKEKLVPSNNGIIGKYYLVPASHPINPIYQGRDSSRSDSNWFYIQLSIQSNYGLDESFTGPGYVEDGIFAETDAIASTIFNDVFKYGSGEWRYHQLDVSSMSLIKLQPVRKCGKIDIYTKKKGLVASLVNNRVQSPGHDLSTNDIIEINSALYDTDTINNYASSRHPMNGKKFVRVVDDDNFEIYEDQFFKDPTTTSNLRTTDSIYWVCISNEFGTMAQSWNYHGSLFSPTGRNGYRGIHTSQYYTDEIDSGSFDDWLSEFNSFFTTKRIRKVDDPLSQDLNKSDITLDFEKSFNNIVNTLFAKRIDDNIPQNFNQYDSPLNDIKRSFFDFYPYNCQDSDDDTRSGKTPYKGCRFGASLDFKFSHKSGNSKVYTLAVGEPGSDISVDLFGLFDEEGDAFDTRYCKLSYDGFNINELARNTIYGVNRRRVIPWYLPYGKVHVFTITVDQYNNITNISHQNTLFGGGSDILNSSYVASQKENNPWKNFEFRSRLSYDYNNTDILRYRSFKLTFSSLQENEHFIDINSRIVSRYWIRSCVLHWRLNSIRSFKDNNEPSENTNYHRYFADNILNYRPISNTGNSLNNLDIYSRFGFVGFSLSNIPVFEKIHRFKGDSSSVTGNDQTYKFLFPWVDSFGKSVAIKNDSGLSLGSLSGFNADDPKTIIVAGSTTRSNIEINNSLEQPVLAGPQYFQISDCDSYIGQLTAHYLYRHSSGQYRLVDFTEINAGGSNSGRYFSNFLSANRSGIQYKYLANSHFAGYGLREVISSCHLSASKIEFFGDKLVWADQRLYDNVSTLNILQFDDQSSTQSFRPYQKIERAFDFGRSPNNPSTLTSLAYNTGDGFAFNFKIDDDFFVTNTMDVKTDLDYSINDFVDNIDRINTIYLYEFYKNGYRFAQKISPSINVDNELYPRSLINDYSDYLINVNNVNYDNTINSTYTWNIDLTNRYDIVNKKILIKDPLEYSLFSRDFSKSQIINFGSTTDQKCQPYLGVYERSKLTPYIYNTNSGGERSSPNTSLTLSSISTFGWYPDSEDRDPKPNGSSLKYIYIDENSDSFLSSNHGGYLSEQFFSYVPIFYFNIPIDNLDTPNSLTFTFRVKTSENLSIFERYNGSSFNIYNYSTIIPRIVLYGKDPRSMVVRNGPSSRLTKSSSFPKYKNGLFTEVPPLTQRESRYSYEYPGWYRGGAQDLFFYGRLPKSSIKNGSVTLRGKKLDGYLYGGDVNLGDYYDLTSGVRNGEYPDTIAGDPAWVSPDIYHELNQSEKNSIIPYAKIFTPISISSIDGGSYYNIYLTIDKEDIKKYIIPGNIIKDNNRPTFNDNFVGEFDDSENLYGSVNKSDITNTLIIGLFLTNINSFNINNGSISHTILPNLNSGPLKYINESNQDKTNYVNANYPYCHHSLFYTPTIDGNKWNGQYLNYSMKSSISNINLTLNKTGGFSRRYNNKFHKIAVFEYDKESRDDVRKNYSSSFNTAEKITYESFGFDRFVPAPISIKNPVISIGKFSESSSEKLQILNSENILDIDSSYYLDPESGQLESNVPPRDVQIGLSRFNNYNLLGSFDIDDDEYLPLTIRSDAFDDNGFNLVTEGCDISQNNTTLFINSKSVESNNITLFTGQRQKSNLMPLYMKHSYAIQASTLFIKEIQPSSIMPLYIRSIDHESSFNIIMNPQTTGILPLNIRGPLLIDNSMPLVWTAYHADQNTAFISGVYGINSSPSLFMSGIFGNSSQIPLTFSPGFSGVTTLNINAKFSSGNFDLAIRPRDSANNNATLYTRTKEENQASLYIINKTYFDYANLFTNGWDSFNTNLDLFVNGSIGSGCTSPLSLFIGKEINKNENIPLYISSLSGGPGSDPNSIFVGDNLHGFIRGDLYAMNTSNTPLYINVPATGYVNLGSDLFIKVDEPIIGAGGGILSSGITQLYIDGNNNDGVYYKTNKNISLIMNGVLVESSGIPLYINRPYAEMLPLNIKNTHQSGNINVYISGNYMHSNNMNLFIKTPESNNFRFFFRGFSE